MIIILILAAVCFMLFVALACTWLLIKYMDKITEESIHEAWKFFLAIAIILVLIWFLNCLLSDIYIPHIR